MINREGLEYLVSLGEEKEILVETDQGLFTQILIIYQQNY
ncbi:hypothetical protein HAHI6034_11060 [Hathewaya histolytica]|uniref:Uncharacterized protein n=1 Tax=Hathewaya histolytica TaxID=1498 RepID=A0A4U9RDW0_HATHI|nr:Uncharacterised protein [Hathewaya histolytica]